MAYELQVYVGINALLIYSVQWGYIQVKPTLIWMRESNGLYEYIAVYGNDLLIAARDPNEIIVALSEKQKLKLKSVGPLTYHLGCNYVRDQDGTLCCGPK
jgi:hypothetical protein